jgi:hypothetical protein
LGSDRRNIAGHGDSPHQKCVIKSMDGSLALCFAA